jgi:hypothetical protein
LRRPRFSNGEEGSLDKERALRRERISRELASLTAEETGEPSARVLSSPQGGES